MTGGRDGLVVRGKPWRSCEKPVVACFRAEAGPGRMPEPSGLGATYTGMRVYRTASELRLAVLSPPAA